MSKIFAVSNTEHGLKTHSGDYENIHIIKKEVEQALGTSLENLTFSDLDSGINGIVGSNWILMHLASLMMVKNCVRQSQDIIIPSGRKFERIKEVNPSQGAINIFTRKDGTTPENNFVHLIYTAAQCDTIDFGLSALNTRWGSPGRIIPSIVGELRAHVTELPEGLSVEIINLQGGVKFGSKNKQLLQDYNKFYTNWRKDLLNQLSQFENNDIQISKIKFSLREEMSDYPTDGRKIDQEDHPALQDVKLWAKAKGLKEMHDDGVAYNFQK